MLQHNEDVLFSGGDAYTEGPGMWGLCIRVLIC